MDCRRKIILDYAKWTVLSALRSGSPVKSRQDVYSLLDEVDFAYLLDPNTEIYANQFNAWHKKENHKLCNRESRLQIGWSAKMINVYLKTASYIGGLGHKNTINVLHPPIDTYLVKGIKKHFKKDQQILQKMRYFKTIKGIEDYDRDYSKIIQGCKLAAQGLGCLLIEVDQLWQAPVTPLNTKP